MRRVAARRSRPARQSSRSIGTATGPAAVRSGAGGRASPAERVGQVDAEGVHAAPPRAGARATARTRTPAARSRRASRRSAAVRAPIAVRDLQPHAGVGGEQRQHGVRGRGRPQLHPVERARSAPSRSPPARLEGAAARAVVAGGALAARAASACSPPRAGRRSSAWCDARRDLAQEAQEALARLAAAPRAGRTAPGVSDSVTARRRRAGRAAAGSTLATASHSHSSPNGQVPKPST